ncbi:MAG: hypothetical protein M1839_003895 [Geoglossum umbratile]|nr:MAG: hypothetical protein M1839_003895 [Geoglossum umbratile]
MDNPDSGAEEGRSPGGGPLGVDQLMAPQSPRIIKRRVVINAREKADVSIEEPLNGDSRLPLGASGCYWQSDSWEKFKDLEDSCGPTWDILEHLEAQNKPELSRIDVEPPTRVKAGVGEDAVELSGHVKSAGMVSSTTALGMLIGEIKAAWDVVQDADGTEEPRRALSKHMSWYINLLSDIAGDESTTDPIAIPQHIPHVLSNPFVASLWIREQMRDKWKRMYGVTLAPQRAEMRRRIRRAGSSVERQDIACETTRLKRRALKRVVADELSEVARALRQTLEIPLQGIESLYALLLAQQHLFLRLHSSLPHLITIQDQQHSSLARCLSQTTPSLGAQLDAINGLFDIGLRTVSAMKTRINRVAAKDVRDVVEREKESKRRLEDLLVALGYLTKVEEDFGFLRLWAKTVESGFENVEEELVGLAGRAVDLSVAVEACVLFAEE